MTKPVRIVLAAALVVVASSGTLWSADQIALGYAIQGQDGIIHRTTVFEPAVAATVATVAALIFELAFLVWTIVRRPPVAAWLAAVAVAAIALIVPLFIGELSRPTF